MKIFYTKKDRQIIEGLNMLEDGIRVQLEHAEGHLNNENTSDLSRQYWAGLRNNCNYVLSQIDKIKNGKLHY